ncbi:MAG: FAD-binding protein [Gammaproteobacteria bacterium]|nr:FAD-binding protein [Gammaproteobacteria bacterium]
METFDVVVVGYGFAGGVAAIAAHDAGAKVLLVEKMANPGGISICSAGGVRVARDADAALRYSVRTNAGTAPVENLEALALGMTGIGDFVADLAAPAGATLTRSDAPGNYPFDGYDTFGFISVADVPGFDPRRDYPHVRGLRGGARLFRIIQGSIAARGIEVQLGTAAGELIRDGGTVTGVMLDDGTGARLCRATGGVILACGGFEAGEEMKLQYWQERPVASVAYSGNTGDGIRMAQAVGADLWHMWHYHGSYGLQRVDDPDYPYGIRLTRFPDWTPGLSADDEVPEFFLAADGVQMPWIVVDRTGRRYMNEYPPYPGDTGHRPMSYFDPVTQDFPRIPSWAIFDQEAFDRYAIGFPTYNDPHVSLDWSADNSAELASGLIRRADNASELAAIVGCEVDTLEQTLVQWNAIAVGDCTDPFGRDPAMGRPMAGPPWYAASVWPMVSNTRGGPVHDPRQRVLDPFRKPIDGLYAAGELGSVFGHLYISGGNLAECFIGGRIAGREAAERARE